MKKNLRNKFSLFKYFLLICVSITTLTFGMNEGFAQSGDDIESVLRDFHNRLLSKPKITRERRETPSKPPTYNNNRERNTQPLTVSEKPKAKKTPTEEKPTEEKPVTIPNGFSLAQDPLIKKDIN